MVRSIGGAGAGCARDPKAGWPAGGRAVPSVSTAGANGPNSSRSAAGRGGTAGAAGSGAAGAQRQPSAPAGIGSQQDFAAGAWQHDRGAGSLGLAQQQLAPDAGVTVGQAQAGPGVCQPASSVAAAVIQVKSARPIPDRNFM